MVPLNFYQRLYVKVDNIHAIGPGPLPNLHITHPGLKTVGRDFAKLTKEATLNTRAILSHPKQILLLDQ